MIINRLSTWDAVIPVAAAAAAVMSKLASQGAFSSRVVDTVESLTM